MTRPRTEVHLFSREDLEHAAKAVVKSRIIGGYYIGEFGEQATEWLDDGSLKVLTTHTPGGTDA